MAGTRVVEVGEGIGQIVAADVLRVNGDGTIDTVTAGGIERRRCLALLTSRAASLAVEPGDRVLVWHSGVADDPAVILGRVGPSVASPQSPDSTPDEVVIEADKQLTIKCGDGSITIRRDGKILIKGKDLISHAMRLNRIKGGAVQIN